MVLPHSPHASTGKTHLDQLIQDLFVNNTNPFNGNAGQYLAKLGSLARSMSSNRRGHGNDQLKCDLLVADMDLGGLLYDVGKDPQLQQLACDTLDSARNSSNSSSGNCYDSTVVRYKAWCMQHGIPAFPILIAKTSLFLHFFAVEPIKVKGRSSKGENPHHPPPTSVATGQGVITRMGRRSPTTIRNGGSYLEWARKKTIHVFSGKVDGELLSQSVTEHGITHAICDVVKNYLQNIPTQVAGPATRRNASSSSALFTQASMKNHPVGPNPFPFGLPARVSQPPPQSLPPKHPAPSSPSQFSMYSYYSQVGDTSGSSTPFYYSRQPSPPMMVGRSDPFLSSSAMQRGATGMTTLDAGRAGEGGRMAIGNLLNPSPPHRHTETYEYDDLGDEYGWQEEYNAPREPAYYAPMHHHYY